MHLKRDWQGKCEKAQVISSLFKLIYASVGEGRVFLLKKVVVRKSGERS